MVGIQGLGGIPDPKSERPAKVRDSKDSAGALKSAPAKDDVVISSEAQAAARLAGSLDIAKMQTDVRTDKVMAAKDRIDQGDYKKPEVVAKVAERISKYLP